MRTHIISFAAIIGVIVEFVVVLYIRCTHEDITYGGEYLILSLFILLACLLIELLDIKQKKKMCNAENYAPWIYIASPYSGNIKENTQKALLYSKFAANQNCLPICPHLYFTQFLDDSVAAEREKGLNFAIQMLERCVEVWVFGERTSEGMRAEIEMAVEKHIPIRYFTINCEEVIGT